MSVRDRTETVGQAWRRKAWERYRRVMDRMNPEGVPLRARKVDLQTQARIARYEAETDAFASRRYKEEFLPAMMRRYENEFEASDKARQLLERYLKERARLVERADEQMSQAVALPGDIVRDNEGRHGGLDIALPPLTPIIESQDAHVLYVGAGENGEPQMRIKLADGTRKRVAHLHGRYERNGYLGRIVRDADGGALEVGDVVPAGQILGLSSDSGKALHVEVEDAD